MHPTTLLLPTALFAASASAWGMLGHRTVALLSTRYLLPDTAIFVKSLLPKPQSMVSASTWPDYYAHTPDGRYSAPWHWIDSHDNPPHTCEVNYHRDCGGEEGCIVSAIVNMTARVTDEELSFYERQMALKFIIHFIGDIHQPLHTEDLLRGGNQIYVLWGKQHTNLHHVWDSSIAEKHQGGSAVRHAVGWADTLHTEIEGGKYSDVRGEWSACVDPARAEECALSWAGEANRWMCDYVLPQTYPGGLEGLDVSGEYYEGAIEIVDVLVAKAGWRLAGYLNMIVTGRTGLEEGERAATVDAAKGEDWVGGDRYAASGQELKKRAMKMASTGWWGHVRVRLNNLV
ncbi:uncharacterized protein H6S33_005577 [Morchella sextelata]|uniref:uncharacterized protein n=1 Tax=Morchella sextelata TaxID=1174677 RepID=UPI001D0468E0|nr:uncharacterized protein H6S33_005577 [Morchella sextelata]KAH0613691.1 hypothetical protein H6S33_005577 [Morchella sextelata]